MSATVLTSVLAQGGRTSRYGDFTVVHMLGCSFITTPMEFMQMQNWARGRASTGNPSRDRTTFVERFETVLARVGGGVATRGNRSVLSRIVKAMKASSMFLEEWSIPRDLEQGMEMKRPKGWVAGGKPAVTIAVAAVTPAPVATAPVAAAPVSDVPADAVAPVVTLIVPILPK
jgi:hypothetical protein